MIHSFLVFYLRTEHLIEHGRFLTTNRSVKRMSRGMFTQYICPDDGSSDYTIEFMTTLQYNMLQYGVKNKKKRTVVCNFTCMEYHQ